jgi:methyl-accepting chemotaxis protein
MVKTYEPAQGAWSAIHPIIDLLCSELLKGTERSDQTVKVLALTQIRPTFAVISQAIDEMDKLRQNEIRKEAEADIAQARWYTWFQLIFSGTMIAVGLGVGLWLASRLATHVATIASQLSDSSSQVAGTSSRISASSHSLAGISANQNSSAEETSASLEELTAMVETNLRNAEKGLEVVDSVRSSAEQGRDSATHAASAMQEILQSNERIESLVTIIAEVGKKTKIIDEIVMQTQLLSFNASIEAARAGQHGRGFGIVAEEVGKLAQMSGKAALAISEIVNQSVQEAQKIAAENRSKVVTGNELVQKAAQVLQEIHGHSESVLDTSRQIVNASKEQAIGIRQIGTAMQSITRATHETAQGSQQASSASELLSKQAGILDRLVLNMRQLIDGDNSRNAVVTPVSRNTSAPNNDSFKAAA